MTEPACMYTGCTNRATYEVSKSVHKCQVHAEADNREPWGSVERVFYERGERPPPRRVK